MPFASIGYTGTVDYSDWAVLTSHLGAQYSVFGVESLKVAAGTGDRGVRMGVGRASGQGILDIANVTHNLTGVPVGSGSRWDMVALRRDWDSDGDGSDAVTTPVLITGSATKQLPTRNMTPGVLDDQPFALVRFAAGQTAVQEIVDLRCWHGDGGLVAADPLALQYLDRVGTQVRIGTTLWQRVPDQFGGAPWVAADLAPPVDTGWVEMTRNGGWQTSQAQVRRVGKTVHVRLIATRGEGWGIDGGLATIPEGFRPGGGIVYLLSSNSTGAREFAFHSDGSVYATQPSNGATGVTFNASWLI